MAREFKLTLADALRCSLTTKSQLKSIERGARKVGRLAVADAARAELDRRDELRETAPCDGGPTPGGCH
jgi:hypothetical protein